MNPEQYNRQPSPSCSLPSCFWSTMPKRSPEMQEHLGFAIKESREMKMQPSLKKALRHKQVLGA